MGAHLSEERLRTRTGALHTPSSLAGVGSCSRCGVTLLSAPPLGFSYLLSVLRDLLLPAVSVLLPRRDAAIAPDRRLGRAELCVGRTGRSLCGIEKVPSTRGRLREAVGIWCFRGGAAKPIPLCSSPFVIPLVDMTTVGCWNS